ncbi:hypothetical protein [uncultured Parolsenella sp.]|uniref:hypothetical protein n=1 Tax=uncultured Parolsenella sp. TaxID=2083008 RepID=UPI0025CD6B0B|nr:hypothetical protein [uncultured Parolsenella sp.]
MDTSNDARREVARQLNHYAYNELEGGSLLKTLKAVTGATSWRGCLTELAMLIKPNECHMYYDRKLDSYMCTHCGESLEFISYGVSRHVDKDYRFCPSCGAEVVRDGE